MKTKMLSVLKTIAICGAFLLGLGVVNVYAQTQIGVDTTARGLNVNASELVSSIKNIINFILGVLGLIAVVMIIYAGIKLTSSAGSEDAKEAAKKTITYAVIGLILVAFSWVIVEFVSRALTGAETGNLPS